jgi:hypothetical protein
VSLICMSLSMAFTADHHALRLLTYEVSGSPGCRHKTVPLVNPAATTREPPSEQSETFGL